MMLATHLLEAFLEVAQRGSVTEAAAALGRTQPAISNRLRQLEEELEVTLFEPAGRQLKLTPAGLLLLEECAPLMASLRALPQRLKALESDEPRGPVCIGALPTMANYYLLDTLELGLERLPKVKWCIEVGLTKELFERLHEGNLELLYLIGDFDVQGLEVTTLAQVQILVVASPALLEPDVPLTQALSKAPLLLWRGAKDPSFDLIERHARSLGMVGPTTVEIPHIETLRALALRGRGFALLPDYVVAQDIACGVLVASPLPGFEKTFPLKRYQVSGRRLSPGARWFIEHEPKALK